MAGSVNKVILIGNLGKEPEVRSLQNGGKVCTLRIATSETWKDRGTGERQERTQWHSVVIFNENLVGIAERFLKKGSKVYVEGQLETRKWQDQQGQDRYSTEIKAQRVQFLDRRGEGAQQGEDAGSPRRSFNPTGGRGAQSGQGGQGGQSGQGGRSQNRNNDMGNQAYDDDLGPAFPSEASGMDDVPF